MPFDGEPTAILTDLVDLPPFLRRFLGKALVNHRHDLIEQLARIPFSAATLDVSRMRTY